MNFIQELEQLINKHSVENESNTPDFILAQYIKRSLDNWNVTTKEREQWYGTELHIGNNSGKVSCIS